VYSMGGVGYAATPHGIAAYSFSPPIKVRTGGLRSAQTGGLAASAVLGQPSTRAARVVEVNPALELLVPPMRSRSGYPLMSEAEKDEVVAVVEKEAKDAAAAFDGVVAEVKKEAEVEGEKDAEGGGVATAVAEKEAAPKEDPVTKTIRTELTAPLYTKAGQTQWKAISKEEMTRRKENAEKYDYKYRMDTDAVFNKIRNGLVYQFPGVISRGFTDAWADDEAGVVPAKAATKRAVDTLDAASFDPKLKETYIETPTAPIYTKTGQDQWNKARKGGGPAAWWPTSGGGEKGVDNAVAWQRPGYATGGVEGFDVLTRPVQEGTTSKKAQEAPNYWRWALPFVSDEAWEGKVDNTAEYQNSPWYTRQGLEKWAIGAQAAGDEGEYDPLFSKSLFADPASSSVKSGKSMEKLVKDLPPPYSKAGVAYVNKNGIGDYARQYRINARINAETWRESAFGGESQVDPQWGKLTEEEDPLKDDALTNTLKALAVASRERYGTYDSPPVFETDPWKDSAILNTLRALSQAQAERLQFDKVPRTFKTAAISFTFLDLWEKNAKRFGADTTEFNKFMKQQRAAITKSEEEKESNDAIARTLQDLSAASANWSDNLASKKKSTTPDNAVTQTLQDVSKATEGLGQKEKEETKKL